MRTCTTEDVDQITFPDQWRACKEVSIGPACIRPGSYIVAMKDPNIPNVLWVGKVLHIYKNSGTGATSGIVFFKMESWFSSFDLGNHKPEDKDKHFWDILMKLPCVTKASLNPKDDPYNMVWPSNWTAPVSGVMVLPHPYQDDATAQVVLHKQIDFLEAAGFKYDLHNPHDLTDQPFQTSVELMEVEHKLRQARGVTLDRRQREKAESDFRASVALPTSGQSVQVSGSVKIKKQMQKKR